MLLCLGLRPGATGAALGRRRTAGRRHAPAGPPVRRGDRRRRPARTWPPPWRDGRLDRYVAQSRPRARAPVRPARQPGGSASTVPAPRAGQLVTVPVPDAPVTGVPSDPSDPAAPGRPARPGSTRPSPPGCAAPPTAWSPPWCAQHDTGEVLMVAWMDDEALHRTLTTGRATYWSRSRGEYWVKGATSGHHQYVRSVALDCDGDALLVSVDQVGAACHTGDRTCFFTELPVTAPEDATRDDRAASVSPDRGRPSAGARAARWRVVPVTRRLLADGGDPGRGLPQAGRRPGHVPAGVGRAGRRLGRHGLVAVLVHRRAQQRHPDRAGRRGDLARQAAGRACRTDGDPVRGAAGDGRRRWPARPRTRPTACRR